jgi:leucyl-tRNA synthetase
VTLAEGARMLVGCLRNSTEIEKLALDDAKVQPFIAGKQVVKIIVVPDKLVNIVVR